MNTNNNLKKFISLVLSFVLMLSCLPVFAMPIAGEVVKTTTAKGFTTEISGLTEEYPAEVTDTSNEYATSRLFAKADGDFNTYGADKVVTGLDGLYVLQYSSPEEAETAESKIEQENSDVVVEPEQIYSCPENIDYKATGYNSSDAQKDNHVKWANFKLDDFENYVDITKKDPPPEVKVAVIDTGFNITSNYFTNRIANGGVSYATDGAGLADIPPGKPGAGHGTNVAGIITQLTTDNVKILPIKVFDNNGVATTSAFWLCLQYAVDQNVKVINISLGISTKFDEINNDFISRITGNNVLVCAAAGNDCYDSNGYTAPGNYNVEAVNILTVGSCNDNKTTSSNPQVSTFSNIGSGVEIYAPGENVWSASYISDTDSIRMSGTSQATPIISATAANILTLNPNLSGTQVKWIITNKCDVGGLFDNTYTIPVLDGGKIKDWILSSGLTFVPNFLSNKEQMQNVTRAFTSTDLSKDGSSKNNAYIISTKEQLVNLSTDVNRGYRYTGKYFRLANDIDMSGVDFTPIGTWTNPFQGNFYGEGHVISKLYINKQSQDSVGLFGVIEGAYIERLAVLPGIIQGRNVVGAIAGTVLASTIREVYTDKDPTDSNCSIIGNKYVGGIAGIVVQAGMKTTVNGTSTGVNRHGIYNVYSKNISITGVLSGGLVGGYFSIAQPGSSSVYGAHFLYNSYAKNTMKTIGASGQIIGSYSNYAIPYYVISTMTPAVAGVIPYTANCTADTSAPYAAYPLFAVEPDLSNISPTKLKDTYCFDTTSVWNITNGKNENMPFLQNMLPYTAPAPTPTPTFAPTPTPTSLPTTPPPTQTPTPSGKLPINASMFRLNNTSRIYGEAKQPDIIAQVAGVGTPTIIGYKLNGGLFNPQTSIANNSSVGTYEITVRVPETANYNGGDIALNAVGQTFTINKASISVPFNISKKYDGTISLGDVNKYYRISTGINGEYLNAILVSGIWSSSSVGTSKNITFLPDSIVWTNDTNTGGYVNNYNITATGKGTIVYRYLNGLYVVANDIIYNGKSYSNYVHGPNINESPIIKYTGIAPTIYNSAVAPTNAGNYMITVSYNETSNHSSGIVSHKFSINKADISKVSVSAIANNIWNGRQIKPVISTITLGGVKLATNINATITYGANKNIGKGIIRLTGKENFIGIKVIYFNIIPQKNAVSSIKTGYRKMTITWSRPNRTAQGISRYQIRYRVSGTSLWVTKNYIGTKASAAITKLKKNKRYQVQVRNGKQVSSVWYYSAWSTTKTSGLIR